MSEKKELYFEPYARLLTMLSEQLIKNEVVALTEVVKNSYDADSPWVKITFEKFNSNMVASKNSRIIIEDAGCGMSESTLKNDFINPASAHKKIEKEAGNTTPMGRIYQGEKGIGRFSLFKLGKKITVITKTVEDIKARRLELDLSAYEDEFIKENNEQYKLSEIPIWYSESDDTDFTEKIFLDNSLRKRLNKGTIIIVEELNDNWGKNKFDKLKGELFSLISNVYGEDFGIYFFDGNTFVPTIEITEKKTLENIIEQKAVLNVEGTYDESGRKYIFTINGKDKVVELYDKSISGLSLFRDFKKSIEDRNLLFDDYVTTCGNFKFKFYIFDPDKKNTRTKYKMTDEDWEIVKKNRVFLYRDGIRVFPYGSIKDDWLQVDTIRGTKRASAMFSNDQVVGYIDITYKGNPNLKDKTNREGLLEVGESYSDFLSIIQVFLQHIKIYYYDEYSKQKNVIKKFDKQSKNDLEQEFKSVIEKCSDNSIKKKIENIRKKVHEQNDYNLSRIRVVEDLAGIGLSIQATHHDLGNFIRKCYNVIDDYNLQLMRNEDEYTEKKIVFEKIERLRGIVSAMEAVLADMKNLFASTQHKSKSIRVSALLNKVLGYYNNVFETKKIDFDLKNIGNSIVVINMPEALLMTIFINILDNALYWLEDEGVKEKKIRISINSDENYMVFSDNGPGIYPEEKEKIFEAFFTGKGIEGRGLGLYICRQFLDRYDYAIDVVDDYEYSLGGADFRIDFNKKDE
jgi:hypothetical protein